MLNDWMRPFWPPDTSEYANTGSEGPTQSGEAIGLCRICVSVKGINLYLVSHIVGQCLNYCVIIAVFFRKIKDGRYIELTRAALLAKMHLY